jgi:hypothetical protein
VVDSSGVRLLMLFESFSFALRSDIPPVGCLAEMFAACAHTWLRRYHGLCPGYDMCSHATAPYRAQAQLHNKSLHFCRQPLSVFGCPRGALTG